MLNRDDIARAARNADAQTEEIGFEEFLKRSSVDVQGLLYVSDQRATRIALIAEGRLHEIADAQRTMRPTRVSLGSLGKRLLPVIGSSWIDGFIAGLLSRHDSSSDIPGIDTNTTKED